MTLPTTHRRPRATWIATLAAVALASHVDASVLCGRRNSAGEIADGATIKLRAVCKDNELALNPIEAGLQVLPTITVRTGNVVSTNGSLSSLASCEPGETATGGGGLSTGSDGARPVMRSSRPQPDVAGAQPPPPPRAQGIFAVPLLPWRP